MIIADKIIAQRKKNGWTQEELAEKMNVSRQSVSKWEGSQSVPELEKILLLSQLFGVSTDYLLKDELEESEYVENSGELQPVRRVTMEIANEFLQVKADTAKKIALATFLCIISPVGLLLFTVASQVQAINISQELAGGIGMVTLLLLIAPAVALFIFCGAKTEPYEYLEKEVFETEYGVAGMVREQQKQYKDTYTRHNILGTCSCILSIIPLLCAAFFTTENSLVLTASVCIMLFIVAIAVALFITAGIRWESMLKLLQEGDHTAVLKKNKTIMGAISTTYWLVVVAGYLAYSFSTHAWHNSWIVWPVAGVLYAAVAVLANALLRRK